MVDTDGRIKAAPGLLFAGIDLWDEGRPAEALEKFEAVLGLQPRNDLARSYRALCMLAMGKADEAAGVWREFGFSDNTMFRVRVAEYVEGRWLEDQSFMGAQGPVADGAAMGGGAAAATSAGRGADSSLAGGAAGPGAWSQRRALKRFYKRDFAGLLRYVSPPPVENEVEAFLAATALEMLRRYGAARAYLDSFMDRREEWPDALVALKARLDVRAGRIREAAREFAGVVVMGPEDFGINYYMGVVCLAYEKREEARQYFVRAFTSYMVDTLEFQWWQLEQVLLHPEAANNLPAAGAAGAG